MNWPSILLWGLVATTILSILMRGSQSFGLTRMDIPFMIGTMFTPDRDRAKLYGFLFHLLNGWLFSFVYAFAFEQLNQANWWIGGIAGFVHGLFVLMVALPILPGLHPRMSSDFAGPVPLKPLEPPGFLALNYGKSTPIATMIGHVVYGVIVGGFYGLL